MSTANRTGLSKANPTKTPRSKVKGHSIIVRVPFRYGGLFRRFDLNAGEILPKGMCRCYVCGKDIKDEKGYAATYRVGKGTYKFRLLCRKCAYSYGRGVIEEDGEIHAEEER